MHALTPDEAARDNSHRAVICDADISFHIAAGGKIAVRSHNLMTSVCMVTPTRETDAPNIYVPAGRHSFSIDMSMWNLLDAAVLELTNQSTLVRVSDGNATVDGPSSVVVGLLVLRLAVANWVAVHRTSEDAPDPFSLCSMYCTTCKKRHRRRGLTKWSDTFLKLPGISRDSSLCELSRHIGPMILEQFFDALYECPYK